MTNRCEGVPTGRCQYSCSDASVKYGIYDLFLCPSCDAARDNWKELNTENETDEKKQTAAAAKTTKKSTRSKKQVDAKSQSLPSTDDDTREIAEQKRKGQLIETDRTNEEDEDGATCPHCLLSVDGARHINCDICQQNYHQKCTNMPIKVFDKFIVHASTTGWVCDECKAVARSSFRRLEVAVAELAEQVALLKCEANSSRAMVATVARQQHELSFSEALASPKQPVSRIIDNDRTTDINDIEAKTVLIVQRTINDSSRRKRNVVITGLPETDDGDDRSLFLSFCEEHLPIKPVIDDKSCIRLGKKTNGRPRRLLVKLNSEETATSLLRSAPALSRSTDQDVANRVYINADLSPAASQLAYEARQARRQAAARRRHETTDNNDTAPAAAAAAPGRRSQVNGNSIDGKTTAKDEDVAATGGDTIAAATAAAAAVPYSMIVNRKAASEAPPSFPSN